MQLARLRIIIIWRFIAMHIRLNYKRLHSRTEEEIQKWGAIIASRVETSW